MKDESRAMTRTLLTAALYALILAAIIYAVANGEQPPCDCNQSGVVDIGDAVSLINLIFLGIEPPRLDWWERDTTSTVLVFDGRTYIMRNHNIEHWRQFVVAGNDTGVVEWYRIGESVTIDSNKIVEVK